MNYILSVVIPTKNRYQYLRESLKTLVSIDANDMEIIVQDNTENNKSILKYIDELNYSNLKYFHEKKSLTVSENSDLAIAHSTGDYVCFIGDDDSITEALIDLAKLMKKYSVDACNTSMAHYYWPDSVFKYFKRSSLSFNSRKVIIRKYNTDEMLVKALRNGMQEIKYLPRVYHAVISRKILELIKNKTGSCFPGPSPDMANAVAASLIIEKHYYIDMPLIISGSSLNSGAGKGAMGKHKGSLAGLSHLPLDIEETWDKRIPKLWLAHTIWPESCVKALKSMNSIDYEKFMNWNAMFARILLRNPDYLNIIKMYIPNKFDAIKVLGEMIKALLIWVPRKIVMKANKILKLEYSNKKSLSLTKSCMIINRSNSRIDNKTVIEKAFRES